MSLTSILAKIPAAFHKLTPALLVGIDPSGEPAAIHTDSDGALLAIATVAQSGAGWTLSGDSVTVDRGGATWDTWSLRTGGVSGTVIQAIVVSYTDTTKTVITSIVRGEPT